MSQSTIYMWFEKNDGVVSVAVGEVAEKMRRGPRERLYSDFIYEVAETAGISKTEVKNAVRFGREHPPTERAFVFQKRQDLGKGLCWISRLDRPPLKRRPPQAEAPATTPHIPPI